MDHAGDITQSADIDAAVFTKVKPVRYRTKRRSIATRDPVAQKMWAEGYGTAQIAQAIGVNRRVCSHYFGVIDPTPQPLGCYAPIGRAGESGEARAFRRFPINSHKPGPG